MERSENVVTDKAKAEKAESMAWWDGRQLAIRPDVPGRDFDPGDLVLVQTEDEWNEIETRIDSYTNELKQQSIEQLWPEWMSEDE
jgi:hypothetical protein